MFWLTPILWIPSVALFAYCRRRDRTWLSPATVFTGCWSVLAGVPILVGPIPVAPAGMVYVLAAELSVIYGSDIARRLSSQRPILKRPVVLQLPLIEWLVIGCTLLGLATVAIDLASRGHGIEVFLSLSTLANTAREFSIARYSNNWQEPIAARILVSSTYVGALLAGVVIAIRTSRARWVALVVFLPSLLLAGILTTKTSLVLPIILAVSSYTATRIAFTNAWPRTNLRQLGLGAAGSLAIGSVLVFVQMARYGYSGVAGATVVLGRFWIDALAYMGVFSAWFQNGGWRSLHPAGGFYTFAGLFDLLHIGHRTAGLYTDQAIVYGEPYNLYTVFRGLIEDFTLPGSLLALGLIGYGAHRAYAKVAAGDLRYSPIVAAFFAFTIWGFIVDIFIYNTIVAAYLALAVYVFFDESTWLRRFAGWLDIFGAR